MNADQQPSGQVTQILAGLGAGHSGAASELLPLVYDELRHLAASKLAREKPGQTLQATALVHEAWLRLVNSEQQNWQNRSYFFAAAAEAMRRILVESARRKCQLKRGGQYIKVDLEGIDLPAVPPDEQTLLVDEALQALAKEDPVEAEVVKLHFFVGLKHAEIAEVLGLSERTVKRYWAFAKVWLFQHIREAQDGTEKQPG